MFIQCLTNPCARTPAMMIAKNVIVASAAVTLKLPVAVVPPCVSLVEERILWQVQDRVIEQRKHVEERDQPDQVRRRG